MRRGGALLLLLMVLLSTLTHTHIAYLNMCTWMSIYIYINMRIYMYKPVCMHICTYVYVNISPMGWLRIVGSIKSSTPSTTAMWVCVSVMWVCVSVCVYVWSCVIVWVVRHYCMRHTVCVSHGSWRVHHHMTECMHKTWRMHDDACDTTHHSCKLMHTHNFRHVIMSDSCVIVIMRNHMTIIVVMWLCRTHESLWLWIITWL